MNTPLGRPHLNGRLRPVDSRARSSSIVIIYSFIIGFPTLSTGFPGLPVGFLGPALVLSDIFPGDFPNFSLVFPARSLAPLSESSPQISAAAYHAMRRYSTWCRLPPNLQSTSGAVSTLACPPKTTAPLLRRGSA